MPRIGFFGITIAMYWDEPGHQVVHFYAEHAGHIASIAIDGTALGGTLPRPQLRLVREWAQLHRDELLADWERARRSEPLERNRAPRLTWPRSKAYRHSYS